jgi:hypothetical protein
MSIRLPDPIVDPADGTDPGHEAVVADSVGLGFDEIASIVDRLCGIATWCPFALASRLLERRHAPANAATPIQRMAGESGPPSATWSNR